MNGPPGSSTDHYAPHGSHGSHGSHQTHQTHASHHQQPQHHPSDQHIQHHQSTMPPPPHRSASHLPTLPPPRLPPPMPSMSPTSHTAPHHSSSHYPPSLPPPGPQQPPTVPSSTSYHNAPAEYPSHAAHGGTLPPVYGHGGIGGQYHGAHTQQQGTQQSTQGHSATGEQSGQMVPVNPLEETSKEHKGRKYKLVVVQQPKRARMCGFGDKDRRPITPPPCVRLLVMDVKDGKPTNDNDIPYTSFVCNVTLHSEDGLRDLDVLRHSSGNPSISSTTTTSFASIQENPPTAYNGMMAASRQPGYAPPVQYNNMGQYGMPYGQQSNPHYQGYEPVAQYYPSDPRSQMMSSSMPSMGYPYPGAPDHAIARNSTQNISTRNLVGQSAVSAHRLIDTEDQVGVWFVLHDLSVRTEGTFRLKFTVTTVSSDPNNPVVTVNQGVAPVVSICFSDAFTVYSAKKFPGVCESTQLSKCFATQGIKIPIRKEGGMDRGGNNHNDEDDD